MMMNEKKTYYIASFPRSGIELPLPDMIRHPGYGISALAEHTNSYVKNCAHLLIIAYEKLQAQPFNLSPHSMRDAMSKIEKKKGRKFGRPDFKFTRKGQIGEARK